MAVKAIEPAMLRRPRPLFLDMPSEPESAAVAAGAGAATVEGEEIRMEDVLGKGTRKRPSAATEDVDELQAETRRF